jgi:hypothetical protein
MTVNGPDAKLSHPPRLVAQWFDQLNATSAERRMEVVDFVDLHIGEVRVVTDVVRRRRIGALSRHDHTLIPHELSPPGDIEPLHGEAEHVAVVGRGAGEIRDGENVSWAREHANVRRRVSRSLGHTFIHACCTSSQIRCGYDSLDHLRRPARPIVRRRWKRDRVRATTATDESPGNDERTATHGDETEYQDANDIRRKRDPHAGDPGDDADGPKRGAAGDENRS